MKYDEKTINVYNEKTIDYQKMTKSFAEMLVEKDFAASIPVGGCVLDYGCGPGRSAGYFAECGLQTHAFDASFKMVNLAKTYTDVKVWQGSFATAEPGSEVVKPSTPGGCSHPSKSFFE